ncbi:hypothetical protein [Bradyrhizobium sp. LB11.1]|uniref:hypothetical protein n=1 Tax=Bradyrhizobium sp. LB11.1 TaxID=3156326 RepID=UPI0033910979
MRRNVSQFYSGRVKLEFIGNASNTNSVVQDFISRRYGTGTAPLNGVALTGFVLGTTVNVYFATGGEGTTFANSGIITGLTPGTIYWFNLGLGGTSGPASVNNIDCSAMEF